MRPVEQKPAVAGAVGTILVWILIFLFFYFGAVLFAPKPFKTIKIRLDAPTKSEKQVKKVEQNSAKTQKSEAKETPKGEDSPHASSKESAPLSPKEQSSLKSSETPAQAKQDVKKTESKPASKKSEPKKAEPKKTETKKTEPKKSELAKSATKQTKQAPSKIVEKPKMAEQTLQKSMEELIAEQQAPKKPAKKEFDWSQFDDMEGNSSSNSTTVAKNTTPAAKQSAFSGSAASSSSQNPTPVSSASKSKSASGQKPSSLTTKALDGVVSAHKYSSTSGGVSSSVTANTGSSSDGKVSIAMSDGTPRILLEPAEPKIILSPEAAAMIDSTKRLTVSFTVSASGNVPVTSVKISPDILPSLVSMEIREQISKWRFASAPNDGLARFDYTIQKN